MTMRTFAIGLVLGAAACADVLQIDEARLDPELTAGALDGSGEASEEKTLCEEYCETVLGACEASGPFAVYDSLFTCERQCERLSPGLDGDQTGNSVECRLFHARVAELSPGERLTECPAAGPGGDGICGSNCDSYCSLMLATCPGYFENHEACRTSCELVPDLGGYDIGQTFGDSLQCRLYHLGAALVSGHHCAHAAGAYPCSAEGPTTESAN